MCAVLPYCSYLFPNCNSVCPTVPPCYALLPCAEARGTWGAPGLRPPPRPPAWSGQNVEEVWTIVLHLDPFRATKWVAKAPENHLEERLSDQAQARALYTPPFWGSFA